MSQLSLSALFQNIVDGFPTQRFELLFECVVRGNVVLIFCPPITGQKAEPYAAIGFPVVFLTHSVNLADPTGTLPGPFCASAHVCC